MRWTWALAVCGLLATTVPSGNAYALSRKVADIFNKNNRVMDPPPKSLSADPAVRSGKKALPSESTDEEEEESEAMATVPSMGVQMPSSGTRARPKTRRTRRSMNEEGGSDRVFGVGFVGAGAYGIFGAEIEFAFTPEWSGGFGIGTGMAYSSWSAFGRYYFRRSAFTPFAQVGYAHWTLGRISSNHDPVQPGYLAERFFSDKNGLIPGATAHLLYPGIGILYQHSSGLAFTAQLQYFISAPSFQGAPSGSFGFHYYF